jgi:hypothetical protein
MNRAFLRIYANCDDEREATLLAQTIEAALVRYEPTSRFDPRRYWKMPELFEFTYDLSSPGGDILRELAASDPAAWQLHGRDGDRSAVWNRSDDRSFLVAATRWAELQDSPS